MNIHSFLLSPLSALRSPISPSIPLPLYPSIPRSLDPSIPLPFHPTTADLISFIIPSTVFPFHRLPLSFCVHWSMSLPLVMSALCTRRRSVGPPTCSLLHWIRHPMKRSTKRSGYWEGSPSSYKPTIKVGVTGRLRILNRWKGVWNQYNAKETQP